jgi:hypothetical protein
VLAASSAEPIHNIDKGMTRNTTNIPGRILPIGMELASNRTSTSYYKTKGEEECITPSEFQPLQQYPGLFSL